jgi:hypothetical protein
MTGTPRMSALELRQGLVDDHAAVDLERLERHAGVLVLGVDHLAALERGRLERGPGDVPGVPYEDQ